MSSSYYKCVKTYCFVGILNITLPHTQYFPVYLPLILFRIYPTFSIAVSVLQMYNFDEEKLQSDLVQHPLNWVKIPQYIKSNR